MIQRLKPLICLLAFICLTTAPTKAACPTGDILLTTQAQVDSFPILYAGCTTMPFNLTIQQPNLIGTIRNLNALRQLTRIQGNLIINRCRMPNLEGLNNLTAIGGSLKIDYNPSLLTLSALQNLRTVGSSIIINLNANITNLVGLDSLKILNDTTTISYNNELINLEGLKNVTKISNLTVIENPKFTNFLGLNKLDSVGSVTISGNPVLANFLGLENLKQIKELKVEANPILLNFDGLGTLKTIKNSLYVEENNTLTNFSGLNALRNVGELFVVVNPSIVNFDGLQGVTALYSCYVARNDKLTNLTGFNNLQSIEAGLVIDRNIKLSTISALKELKKINGYILISDNAILPNLVGLENIDPLSLTSLALIRNNLLSFCSVKSVCAYLSNPNNPRNIADNAAGCNNVTQVSRLCLTPTYEATDAKHIKVTPSVFSDILTIESTFLPIQSVDILDVAGRIVWSKKENTNTIQLITNQLANGIYFVRIATGESVETKKVVKQW